MELKRKCSWSDSLKVSVLITYYFFFKFRVKKSKWKGSGIWKQRSFYPLLIHIRKTAVMAKARYLYKAINMDE